MSGLYSVLTVFRSASKSFVPLAETVLGMDQLWETRDGQERSVFRLILLPGHTVLLESSSLRISR